MRNTIINRKAIKRVAKGLGDLNDDVIFVGGAVISLYVDDPAAADVRPTKDIDISVRIRSLFELENIRKGLVDKGFSQTHEDDVICRFRYQEVIVDVMGTQPVGWAPGNRWFELGFRHRQKVKLDETAIHILPLPYYLSAKFDAYNQRGANDPRTSKDFEDIVYLLNFTSGLADKIRESDRVVNQYLSNELTRILNDDSLQEAVLAHLYFEQKTARYQRIMSIVHSLNKSKQ